MDVAEDWGSIRKRTSTIIKYIYLLKFKYFGPSMNYILIVVEILYAQSNCKITSI